jgi:SAM-dependent MidA family methyltransferase
MPAMISGLPLPAPGPEEESWSGKLTRVIVDEIESSGGVIAFSRFMELALYEPRYGYYVSGLRKFGERGDFVTAPELGDLFSRCLVKLVVHVLDQLEHGEVLEVGAGSGIMAAQMLQALDGQGKRPCRYLILEISDDLRRRQREMIEARAPRCLDRVRWLTQLPESFAGVILANEVADALPVDRFCVCQGRVQGIGVGRRADGFTDRPYAPRGAGWDQLSRLELAEGYCSEIGLHAQAWMRTLCRTLNAGVFIVVDYGYPASELYHPMRSDGTLMCHYHHHAHRNPYTHVGLQDITAHVDFSALARCACESGQSVLGFTSQASFLLSLGILDLIESKPDASHADSILLAQQVKRLTLPSEMGESFKALAVGPAEGESLPGFTLADHRNRL